MRMGNVKKSIGSRSASTVKRSWRLECLIELKLLESLVIQVGIESICSVSSVLLVQICEVLVNCTPHSIALYSIYICEQLFAPLPPIPTLGVQTMFLYSIVCLSKRLCDPQYFVHFIRFIVPIM